MFCAISNKERVVGCPPSTLRRSDFELRERQGNRKSPACSGGLRAEADDLSVEHRAGGRSVEDGPLLPREVRVAGRERRDELTRIGRDGRRSGDLFAELVRRCLKIGLARRFRRRAVADADIAVGRIVDRSRPTGQLRPEDIRAVGHKQIAVAFDHFVGFSGEVVAPTLLNFELANPADYVVVHFFGFLTLLGIALKSVLSANSLAFAFISGPSAPENAARA